MSTEAFPGAKIKGSTAKAVHYVPTTLAGNAAETKADLTIHRISKTHHGRTLLLLGHAAEHLANSRRFASSERDNRAEVEAIHILMGLSRTVFDEFAMRNTRRWQVEQWIVERVIGVIEGRSENRMGRGYGYRRPGQDCITC